MSNQAAHASLISEVTRLLGALHEPAQALAAVARAVVPSMADWCVVSVVDATLGIKRAASHHADPAMQEVMDELRAQYAVDPDSNAGIARVLRTNQPVLVQHVDDSYLHSIAHDARHEELLRLLAPRSAMYVPMSIGAHAIGAITFASAQRTYDDGDVAVATELGNRLALRVDNMRLQQAADDEMVRRLELESDLAASDRSFRALFRANPLPMWVYDLETLAFLEVNDAAIAYYGYTQEEFAGMTIRDIRPEQDVEALVAHVRRGRTPLMDSGVWRHQRRDGHVIDVRVRSHELTHAGRNAVLVISEDVTDQLRAERALHEMNAELERRVAERTAELEAANQELESFSYSVSHDLRSPLRSIDGFSQALLEDHSAVLDAEALDYLRRIRAAAQRMGALIDDLLRLARVTRNELRHEEIDLAELATAVVAELQERDPARTVDIVISGPLPARGDRRLLRIALENLLGNAWKFTSRTSVPRVEVGSERQGDELVYYVRDNGAGFDMQYVHKLFGVFQRLHSPREYEGTGVGLAIVHRIISRHGGSIRAQGAPGAGAAFYFTL